MGKRLKDRTEATLEFLRENYPTIKWSRATDTVIVRSFAAGNVDRKRADKPRWWVSTKNLNDRTVFSVYVQFHLPDEVDCFGSIGITDADLGTAMSKTVAAASAAGFDLDDGLYGGHLYMISDGDGDFYATPEEAADDAEPGSEIIEVALVPTGQRFEVE